MKLRTPHLLLFLLSAVCLLSMAALADETAVWQSGNGEKYATISQAIEANPLYGTITLLQEAAGEPIIVPPNERLTIDFGGFCYTAEGDELAARVYENSVVTLKNGTLTGTDSLISCLILSSGQLTVDSMVLTHDVAVQFATVYVIGGSATIMGDTLMTSSSNIVSDSPDPVSIQGGVFTGSIQVPTLFATGGFFECPYEVFFNEGYLLDESSAHAPHTGQGWAAVDDDSHARTCTVCGCTETAPHSYGAPVFDWTGDGAGNIRAACRLFCKDCGHLLCISDVAVTCRSQTDGGKIYEAAYALKGGSSTLTYRSYREIANAYSVSCNGVVTQYPFGATAMLAAPDRTGYYDFYEDGVRIAENATGIQITVTRDRCITAVEHSDRDSPAEPLVHISTPVKTGRKWDVTLTWAIPDASFCGTYEVPVGERGEGLESPHAEPDAPLLTFVEAGLCYLYDTKAPAAADLLAHGKRVIVPTDNPEERNGSYSLTSEVSADNIKTMYAYGYVKYGDGSGNTRTRYTSAVVAGVK